jgi:hypothetical protein
MYVHSQPCSVQAFRSFRSNLYVRCVRLLQMSSHRSDTQRAIDLERLTPTDDPGGQDEIRISQGVIGVKMSNEQSGKTSGIERFHSELLSRRLRLAYNAGSRIEQVSLPVYNNGNAGTGSRGVGNWSPRAEDDYFRPFGRQYLSRKKNEPPKHSGNPRQLQSWHSGSSLLAAVYAQPL